MKCIHPLPKSKDDIKRMIAGACISVGGKAINYYNPVTGSRILTCGQSVQLGAINDEVLRQHLGEISELAGKHNARGRAELELFMVRDAQTPVDFSGIAWNKLSATQMREKYSMLCQRFVAAVGAEFVQDDLEDSAWRNRMYAALVGHRDDELTESDLLGLSAEFFMQIQWVPGARIEGGELNFDMVVEEAVAGSEGTACDVMVHGLICNLVQEYNDLEYINIGRVNTSMSHRTSSSGRREVYVAQFRQRGASRDTLQIIRMQKWGVREHLDEGKDLLQAMIESEEYTDFILDRRLGCRQLGMNLTPSVVVRKVRERYDGYQRAMAGKTIWSTYFERNYVAGIASDKISTIKLRDPRYAMALATCLGRAAAPNMIAGRCDAEGRVIFDDGDEVVLEDASGIPASIVVADHTGTFGDYRKDLKEATESYAGAVNRRIACLTDPAGFAQNFVAGFLERFRDIQNEYKTRQRAFEALFRHHRCDPAGNFAFRWKLILVRLEQAKPEELAEAIRGHIKLK